MDAAQFSILARSLPDPLCLMDATGQILAVNPAAGRLIGKDERELIGKTLSGLVVDPEDKLEGMLRTWAGSSNATPGALRIRKGSGEVISCHGYGSLIQARSDDTPALIMLRFARREKFTKSFKVLNDKVALLHREIAERKRVELALRESQKMLQLVLDAIPVRVFWKDRESVYLGCNSNFARDAGLDTTEQIIGKEDFELGWSEQAELYRTDDRQVMESGKPKLNYEEPQTSPEGGLRWLQTSKIPLRDLEGNVFGILGIYEDVTDRKKTEEVLRRSQKMEAIGRLSGGIAHDFNNQLGVIIGYLDFMKSYVANDEKPRAWVDTASKAVLRCMDLTRQLLVFSRKQPQKKTVVDLNVELRELETMIARSLTPEVEVQYFLSNALWPTEIDPGEFHDAVLNLVINARDAMPRGGKLLIETSNKYLDGPYASLNPDMEPGDYVQLMLSDTGIGIGAKDMEHIFEPFFTTKPEGMGTGLGLAMVYGFVKRYGGNIKIYSEPGVGTTIRIYLPRSRAAATVLPANNGNVADLPCGDESVLIVDDETDLLQLADQYLKDLGYRTCMAEDAMQAIQILENDRTFDLLFSDVVMPGGMNGYELAQQATLLIPGLKVLLTSGFTSNTIAHNGLARFSAHLLSKPYRKTELAQRVRLVLDETENGGVRVNESGDENILSRRNILVVDDDDDIRELFKFNLEKLGCRVVLAMNSEEAVALYQSMLEGGDPVDITIVDLNIPGGMSGEEIAGWMRKIDKHAKMIVTSGNPEDPRMTHYMNYGFDGVLEKGFDREKIRRLLEKILS